MALFTPTSMWRLNGYTTILFPHSEDSYLLMVTGLIHLFQNQRKLRAPGWECCSADTAIVLSGKSTDFCIKQGELPCDFSPLTSHLSGNYTALSMTDYTNCPKSQYAAGFIGDHAINKLSRKFEKCFILYWVCPHFVVVQWLGVASYNLRSCSPPWRVNA